jgi:hypothetical protein
MKKLLSNIKSPITSIIGLVICGITITSVAQGKMTWQYDGLIGVSVGALFFLIPDKVVNLILDTLQKIVNKPKE